MATTKAPLAQKRRRYADAPPPRPVTEIRPLRRPAPVSVVIEPEPERRVITRDPRTNEVIE